MDELKADIAGFILEKYSVTDDKGAAVTTATDEFVNAITIGASSTDATKAGSISASGYTIKNGDTTIASDALLAAYTGSAIHIDIYKGGICSYTIPIKHFEGSETKGDKNEVVKGEEGYWGVVRNHWYNLEITEISGFGSPETDAPVVPTPEELKTFAVKCAINVVAWSKVSQSTAIGGGNEWK